jgi:outer membrane immunogenic protein
MPGFFVGAAVRYAWRLQPAQRAIEFQPVAGLLHQDRRNRGKVRQSLIWNFMRLFLSSIVLPAILLAAATGAARADPPSWAGGYGGISGGYGWGHSDQTDPGVPPTPTSGGGGGCDEDCVPEDGHYSTRGGLVGGTLGYNWQTGPWVYGVEGDFSWADIKGSSAVCGPLTVLPHPCGTSLDALGTFRERLGFAAGANGNWLLYATGGLAVGRIHGWDALTPASGSVWRAGWTAGAGVETAFAPRWTAKIEYLYVDLGDGQVFNVVPGVPESVSLRANIIRAGINYRFGAPVAAPAPRLYTKAPPVVAGNSWAGWYVGVNAGYVDSSPNVSTSADVIALSGTPETAPNMALGATSGLRTGNGAFAGGVQGGYNFMITPSVLAGIESDIQGTGLKGNAATSTVVPTATIFGPATGNFLTSIAVTRSLDWIGTVRGRLGATVTPSLLLYATGGLAYGRVKSSTAITQNSDIGGVPVNSVAGNFSDIRAGYAVGGGAEWKPARKWSIKAEYLYYDLGSAHYGTGRMFVDEGPTNLPAFGVAGIATTTHAHFNGNLARLGINYHLN